MLGFPWLAVRPGAKAANIFDGADIGRLVAAIFGLSILGGLGRWIDQQIVTDNERTSLLAEFLSTSPDWFFTLTAPLAGMLILFWVAGVRVLYRLDTLEQNEPRLVFSNGDTVIETSFLYKGADQISNPAAQRISVGNFKTLRIPVTNVSTGRLPEAGIEKAVLRLAFFSEHGEPLLHIWGKWSARPQVATVPRHMPIEYLREMDIPPNRNDYWFDVAIQYDGENEWYAQNDQAARYGSSGKYEKYKLPEESLILHSTVSGVNLRKEAISWHRISRPSVTNGSAVVICEPTWYKPEKRRIYHWLKRRSSPSK